MGLRARAVTGSESPSMVDLIEEFEESTILVVSLQGHTRKDPSDATAKTAPTIELLQRLNTSVVLL